jgi:hypothetical protein
MSKTARIAALAGATLSFLLPAPGLGAQEVSIEGTRREVVRCDPRPERQTAATESGTIQPTRRAAEYDVVLDIPEVCVERLRLLVRGVDAEVNLDARVADLVRLDAGADVHITAVDLGINGVEAEALLLVDLDNVVYIVSRALDLLDNNPEIVSAIGNTLTTTTRAVGDLVGSALQPGGLISTTVNTAGRTVQRVLGEGGEILEQTLNAAGNVLGSRSAGNLLDLRILRETTDAAGQTVRRVLDSSGAILEYTLDTAGRATNVRLLQGTGLPGTGGGR